MKITRFYETPEGGSRFEDVELAFGQPHTDKFGNVYNRTREFTTRDSVLVELPHGLDQGWHNAPNRQIVFVLSGHLEVETTDREKRQWRSGEAFMADDVGGKGHLTRVLDGPARLVFVRVPDDFDFGAWCGTPTSAYRPI